MVNDIEAVRNEIIFKAGQIAEDIGLNKSMGQLYVALYLGNKAMSLNELSRICRMSKGNVSINIRRLENWGAARKVWGKDNRKDYYEANRDIIGVGLSHGMKVFSGIVKDSETMLEDVKTRLETLDPSGMDENNLNSLKVYRESLQDLGNLSKKLKSIIKNFKLFENIIKKV